MDYAPINLHARLALAPGQKAFIPDNKLLSNHLSTPIMLDGVRITIDSNRAFVPPVLGGLGVPSFGLGVRIGFFLGSERLTNGYIPAALFGGSRDVASRGATGGEAGAGTSMLERIIWKFSRPLVLQPGEYIVPECWYAGFAGGYFPAGDPGVIVRFTYFGRALPGSYANADAYLPWVTGYVGPVMQAIDTSLAIAGTRGVFRSGATDIANPFDVPVNISSLRAHMLQGAAVDEAGALLLMGGPGGLVADYAIASQYVSVRLTDAKGQAVVRDRVPFLMLSNGGHGISDIDAAIAPKTFWTVDGQWDLTAVTYPDAGAPINRGRCVAMMAVQGWRKAKR